MSSSERELVITHLTSDERATLAKLVDDAAAEGTDWVANPMALALYAVAKARRAGFDIPPVVVPPEVAAKCL